MKKSIIILLIIILIVAVLIGIYLYTTSEKIYELSEEEVLTSGSNELGEVSDMSVTTKEELFNEVGDAVDEHLGI